MRTARLFLLAASLFGCVTAANAVEYRSVGSAPAVLYDAPSAKGRKVYIAPRGMPVELVLTYGAWTKVRDASGDLAWIESRALVPKRNLVVSVPRVQVRNAAQESAAPVFTAERGVLLELVEPVGGGWLGVRHADGAAGYVRAGEVWGE